jgi:hypothetical protein
MSKAIELPTELSDDEFARFTKFVDWSADPADCWFWLGTTAGDGYGRFGLRGRTVLAHRLGWTLHHGVAAPAEMHLDHLCRNRACVNPAHLEVVTNAENSRRGTKARLTPLDVQLIRLVGGALPQREVGAAFGVANQTVSDVLGRTVQPRRRVATWHDVPDVDAGLVLDVLAAVRAARKEGEFVG